jgi:hypothetical protein
MKSVCFSAFILHISGTDRCKIGVRYLIFRPVGKDKKDLFSASFSSSKKQRRKKVER